MRRSTGTGRRRGCEEERGHEPAANSCSRKGCSAPTTMTAAPVFLPSPPPQLPPSAHACLGAGHAPGRLPSITDRLRTWRG